MEHQQILEALLLAYRERRAVDGSSGSFDADAFGAAEQKILHLESLLDLPEVSAERLIQDSR